MSTSSPRREQSQKGEKMNKEGRKELGKKNVIEETVSVNSLARNRCSIKAHFFPGETRRSSKK